MSSVARLVAKLNRPDDAAEAWKALVHHNPDYQLYYKGYLTSRGVDLGTLPLIYRVIILHKNRT
jgi:hypothetical protein